MEEQPPSPKRKKVRSKYASRACVSCRRSKLKCSGENPCQRCTENGKRCFYSEDQNAAEALQNLSRPSPSQPPLSSNPGASNGNGIGRRSILPRHDAIERRASDASVMGLSMEARMARIEGMMETLIQERGTTTTPRMSSEREEAIADAMHTDPNLQSAGELFFPNFIQQRHQSFHLDSIERPRLSASMASPISGTESPVTIRVGSKSFAFPAPADHQKAVDFFFSDLSAYHPCINEAEFRLRSDKMLSSPALQQNDIYFLALSYMVFACAEIAVETTASRATLKPAGWPWFQAADELVDKKVAVGQGDLTMIQYLIFKTVYLIAVDEPDAAYNTIGIAGRLCFQFGIHQQSSWRNHTPFEIHMQQRIFWTTYALDRQVSLSCGRPYCIRDLDIDTQMADYLYDKDLHPDRPLPDPNTGSSSIAYLDTMVHWSKFAARLWDEVLTASLREQRSHWEEGLSVFNARMVKYTEDELPSFPLLPMDSGLDHLPELRQLRQHTTANVRFRQLRLLPYRQSMLSLRYSEECGRVCGDLALDIAQRVRHHTAEPNHPSSFRFVMATALGHVLLVLVTLLLRDLSAIGLEDAWQEYANAYRDTLTLLQELSTHFAMASRILDDFGSITNIVNAIVLEQKGEPGFPHHIIPANIRELLPYTSLDFAQQSNTGGLDMNRNLVDAEAATNHSTTPLEFQMSTRKGRYGVLWM
ncbi:hypothetical protein DM02DRAFT_618919 [Periconia macrospinosa]|uniref:Zn(2)-C6 fungal-type domain-containing protein n=1 Tax=Periconia macrospinosa TaxID=97972 RepID=A0A2V1D7A2_9PLEO|nr:hypothetical protein DM02DRAFT_618919 [Periconia macrospinosa]